MMIVFEIYKDSWLIRPFNFHVLEDFDVDDDDLTFLKVKRARLDWAEMGEELGLTWHLLKCTYSTHSLDYKASLNIHYLIGWWIEAP